MPPSSKDVLRYHDGTKHHFHRFARSLGHLDWASQPAPFRSFSGSPIIPLHTPNDGTGASSPFDDVSYDQLFTATVGAAPVRANSVDDLLRYSLGLSAWKQAGSARWALRVNPSSGNLHPTEAYVVCGPVDGLPGHAVFHYAPDRHVLEQRCAFDAAAWHASGAEPDGLLIGLTSIHWREAWKYGERAFRYCQHDIGHAVGAVALAAAALGWHARILASWTQRDIAALVGVDRDEDFVEAEREEPACILLVGPPGATACDPSSTTLVAAVRAGAWSGRASQLSEHHVEWTIIDEIAAATRTGEGAGEPTQAGVSENAEAQSEHRDTGGVDVSDLAAPPARVLVPVSARRLFVQRRSAVALDGQTRIGSTAFLGMLDRLMPRASAPWQALWWEPRIHLLLFVHRVDGMVPGLYLLGRSVGGAARLIGALGRDFATERMHDSVPLVRLAAGDCRSLARRLSCDQHIAADGCFSVGMLAEFDAAIDRDGPSAYRRLFWEAGVVGQMLYLEAEAAGLRGTGIGCFYDDPVHDVLGLEGHAFQSLYHFTVGGAVEDRRIAVEPGYAWERV